MTKRWPSVEVVIATHQRPDLLRRAVESVRAQSYAGSLSVTVVFDRQEPDDAIASSEGIPVRVLANVRTPGLPGARNTGILSSDTDLIAFLDDDDEWLPQKLARQVAFMEAAAGAQMASTAIEVVFEGTRSVRRAGKEFVTHGDLLASRMSMLHSSTFLFRRELLVGELGLVDEAAPAGQNEDWDMLLRASEAAPIAHLDEPLVAVRWGGTSRFADAWRTRVEGALWILEKHPDIAGNRRGHARVLSQIAFGYAALSQRGRALHYCRRSIGQRAGEPRAYLALAVACGVPAGWVQRALHRFGRGI